MATRHKDKKALYGWTDYPIKELGDTPGKIAPVRPITVTSYDRDKRVRGSVKGVPVHIKAGYVYRRPGRVEDARCIGHARLCALPFA